ncbi:MAG: DnaJ domain-containing protein [Rhodomicrobium sp.]|nr:DnaJ domain-containing protein [Rhodomicrobium sp.]
MGWIPKVPKADAGKLGAWVRKRSGVLLVFGATLILSRNIGVAILSAMIAYSALQWTGWIPGGGARRTMRGSVSTVQTAYLEMSFDHATGTMSGRIRKGRFAGRALSDFTAAERLDCFAELRSNDAQAAQLFEAYFDRTSPGWNGSARSGSGRGNGASRGMGVEEAYLVLGLDPGATRDDIQAAHRNLMKRFHPDQGGTTYIAAKVNEAKDVLLRHIKA